MGAVGPAPETPFHRPKRSCRSSTAAKGRGHNESRPWHKRHSPAKIRRCFVTIKMPPNPPPKSSLIRKPSSTIILGAGEREHNQTQAPAARRRCESRSLVARLLQQGYRAPYIYVPQSYQHYAWPGYNAAVSVRTCTFVTRKQPSQQISPLRLTHLSHQRLGGLQR